MFLHPARRHWLTLLVLLSVLVFAAPRALAQDGDPAAEPITIGENKVGDLSAETPIAAYAIALGAPQTLDIQALSLSPDFAPALQVYDASGLLLQAAPNSELETVVRIRALTLGAGTYRVEVSSASGQPGQFVFSAQAGEEGWHYWRDELWRPPPAAGQASRKRAARISKPSHDLPQCPPAVPTTRRHRTSALPRLRRAAPIWRTGYPQGSLA